MGTKTRQTRAKLARVRFAMLLILFGRTWTGFMMVVVVVGVVVEDLHLCRAPRVFNRACASISTAAVKVIMIIS